MSNHSWGTLSREPLRLNLSAYWPYFLIITSLTFAGWEINKVANKSWKVLLTKLISIKVDQTYLYARCLINVFDSSFSEWKIRPISMIFGILNNNDETLRKCD